MPPIGVQAAEAAKRLTRALRLSGKVGLDVDMLASPTVQVFDLDKPAFRTDGRSFVGSITFVLDVALNDEVTITNQTGFPLAIDRLDVINRDENFLGLSVGYPTGEVSLPNDSGNAFTGEVISQSAIAQAVPVRMNHDTPIAPSPINVVWQNELSAGDFFRIVDVNPIVLPAGLTRGDVSRTGQLVLAFGPSAGPGRVFININGRVWVGS